MLGWYIAKAACQVGLTVCLVIEEELVRRCNDEDIEDGKVKSSLNAWARGTLEGALIGLSIASGVVAIKDIVNIGKHI